MDIDLLVVSVGNTRTAFGAFVEGMLTTVRRADNRDGAEMEAALSAAWEALAQRPSPEVAGVCVREDLQDRVAAAVHRCSGRAVRWVRHAVPGSAADPQALEPPFPVLTEHPDRTGLDRVLATAAAYEQLGRACCVVDAGTAVTVNFCSDKGEFLGGAIAPGVRAQLRAMHDAAPALPETALVRPGGAVGRSTEDAMCHGVYHGIRGLVREVVENYATQLGRWPEVIATGGDAELLFGDWELVHAVAPDLLLYGVALAYVQAMEKAA